jgi:thiol-disulfide isomerase/thioredoxin
MSRSALVAALFGGLALACAAEREVDPSVAITPLAIGTPRLVDAEGAARAIGSARAPRLVHFWATWCAPCRRELPSLLDAARATGTEDRVLAITTDRDWAAVREMLGAPIPRAIVREEDGALARLLGVTTLPDTYLVDARGRATRRVPRALDWADDAARAWLSSSLAPDLARATTRAER